VSDVFIAAHPDDETLGCGGTMLKRRAAGGDIGWIVVTQAHEPGWSADVIAAKSREVERVAEAYGARCIRLGLPTTALDTVARAQLIAALREALDELAPKNVYVTHPGDVHSDHRHVFEATVAALRSFRTGGSALRRILCYETLSSTDAAAPLAPSFLPTVFSDVSDTLERKLEVMAMYETEAQEDPLPRGLGAIRALARVRGATVGVQYAEAFQLVRELQP
jgi:LmbE family N-acetylglucosaminyl deacetylase